jgi:metallophosphoesterase (TIGR00282 family)
LSENLSVLFFGDIVGLKALDFLISNIDIFKDKYRPDFIIANGENICNGKGLTDREANMLFECGVNVITTGNHIWDNWKSRPLLAENNKVLRPMNYPQGNPGFGYTVTKSGTGEQIAVLQLQGRTYMQTIDCPFKAADYVIKKINESTNIIIVDFHAEATAEKIAMGHHLDGRVSAIIGTHTHIPTADASIMHNGTGYITDVGMCGPYDSVVGLRKDIALKRFILQTAHKYEEAENDIRICGVHLQIDPSSAQTMEISHFTYPEFERKIVV